MPYAETVLIPAPAHPAPGPRAMTRAPVPPADDAAYARTFAAMFGQPSPTAEAARRDGELSSDERAYAATFRAIFGYQPPSVSRS